MKTFRFTFMTRTTNGLEIFSGYKDVAAKDYDDALRLLRGMDTPFCTFVLVDNITK